MADLDFKFVNQAVTLVDDVSGNMGAVNSLGEQFIVGPGKISTANSTTALLAGGATFTGTFEELGNYSYLTLVVFADVISAANGLNFEWSSDGVNVDNSEFTTIKANAGKAFSVTVRGRYFRVRYVNGATPQGVFRLGVVYHQNGTGADNKPLGAAVDSSNFAQLMQSGLLGLLTGTDDYKNIGAVQNLDGDFSLKVTNAPSTTGSSGGVPSLTKKVRYLDMNAANGGVARGTVITPAMGWVNLFSYSGTGMFHGMRLSLANANVDWRIRLIIDGEELLAGDGNGLLSGDIFNSSIYAMSEPADNGSQLGINLSCSTGNIGLSTPNNTPIEYKTSVAFRALRVPASLNRAFQGGLFVITKET